jgi:molecular chaperone GrpE
MEQDKEVPESVSEEETVAEAVAETEEHIDSEEGGVEHSAEKLHLLLEDARAKADEHWEMVIRARAESDNLKKRHSRELENAHKFAIEKFVNELLPVRDSMELGLTAAQDDAADVAKLVEGTELTLKLLTDVMGKFGIEEINPVGEPFNPEFHQAMAMQPSTDVEPNTVLTVVQKGYTLNERLVRPAMVMVSQAAS